MAVNVTTHESDGATIIKVEGRLTLGDERPLKDKVKELLANGKKRLVLDLKDVAYIDSSGLGTLVSAYTSARNSGAEIKLASLSTKAHQLLTVTKLLTIFDVYDNAEAAAKSFR